MKENDDLWSGILRYRYSNHILKLFSDDGSTITRNESIWWRDLLRVDTTNGVLHNLFSNNILCRLKNESGISFWNNKWITNKTLKETFPEAFANVMVKD